MNEASVPRRSFAVPLGVGTIQGLLLWWLSGSLSDRMWPATNSTLYAVFLLMGVFLPPAIYLLSEWWTRIRTWQVILLTAAALIVAGAHYGSHIESVDWSLPYRRYDPFPLYLTVFVWLFHALPFAQVFLSAGWKRPPYPLLFLYAWRNALQLALAALFTGVFWILLWVWIELFDMLKIHFPKVLFSENGRFSLLVAAIVFSAGYHLSGSADRLLLALRQQVLALLKWLAPVAMAILILFAAALLIRAPMLMASHRHLIGATWLLWLAVITIYLYNAGYQDGDTPEPYPPVVGRLLRYSASLLILVTVMALYALYVRTSAYGLTVSRVWGIFIALITFAYALSYTVAAPRSKPWMGFMGAANVAIAILLT